MAGTLIIGLGGVGTTVCELLRERMLLRYGQPDVDWLRYIFIDTDIVNNEKLQKYVGNAISPYSAYGLEPSGQSVAALRAQDSVEAKRLRLDEWFDPELRARLTDQGFRGGVGGIRMYGRLALLMAPSLHSIRQQIESNLIALQRAESPDKRLSVICVASAGGGTGSGTFMDMGYMTTMALFTMGLEGVTTEGLLAIARPGLTPSQNAGANSAALVSELDYYADTINRFTAIYDGEELPAKAGNRKPFDYMILVSPTQGSEALDVQPVQALAKLQQKMADHLFVRLHTPGETFSRLVDVASGNWERKRTDDLGYPTSFMTVGVALRQFPVGVCRRLGRARTLERLATSWLKPAPPTGEALDDDTIKADPSLDRLYREQIAHLRGLLGLPPDHEISEKSPRDAAADALTLELERVHNGSHPSVHSALATAARDGSVHHLFHHTPGAPVSPSSPGFIKGTIRGNADRLMDRNSPDCLHERIRSSLWAAAFDMRKGPRFALRLAEDLTSLIEADDALIQEVLRQPAIIQEGGNDGSSWRTVQADPLLLFWKDVALSRARRSAGGGTAALANDLHERALIEAKSEIFRSVRTELLDEGYNLKLRLTNLIRFVMDWKNAQSTERHSLDEMLQRLPPGCVFPAQAVDARIREMAPPFPAELYTPVRDLFEPAARTGKAPYKNGKLDFACFERIEATAEDAMAAFANESVLSLLSAQGGAKVQDECAEMVKEGLPLLHLNLDDPNYKPLKFDFPLYHWYAMSDPDSDPAAYSEFWKAIQRSTAGAATSMATPDQGVVSLPLEDSSFAALQFYRNSFTTRIINQYDPERRNRYIAAARSAQPGQLSTATYFSRTDIMLPVPPSTRNEATEALLLAECLLVKPQSSPELPKLWRGPEMHQFEYGAGTFRFPSNDFQRAVAALSANETALTEMNKALNAMLSNPTLTGKCATELDTHIKALTELVRSGQQRGFYRAFQIEGLEYASTARRLTAIGQRWKLPLQAASDPATHPWAELQSNGTWECRGCHRLVDAQNGEPPRDGSCPYCKFPDRLQ